MSPTVLPLPEIEVPSGPPVMAESVPTGATPSAPAPLVPAPVRDAPHLPPKPKSARYHSLDIWRGVACLMLVLYHGTFYADRQWRTLDPETWTAGAFAINAVTRLWIGVPMFFVVSGYCIAASVDSLRRRPYSLSNYFARRFRRIYPPLWTAYLVVILFCLFVSQWPTAYAECEQLPKLFDLPWTSWLGNLTATESWLPGLAGDEPRYLMANTWTLCYEEQFYCVTGLLLVISSRRFFTAAAVMTALVLIARHGLAASGWRTTGFFVDGHWLMFAIGLLVYQRINYFQRRGIGWTRLLLGLGIAYGLAIRIFGHDHAERHFGEYLAVACGFGMLLIVLKRWDRQVADHRLLQPLAWCGRISYSIYLTHFPLVVFASYCLASAGVRDDFWVAVVTLPICTALSLPLGWLFYQAVERRFLNAPVNS